MNRIPGSGRGAHRQLCQQNNQRPGRLILARPCRRLWAETARHGQVVCGVSLPPESDDSGSAQAPIPGLRAVLLLRETVKTGIECLNESPERRLSSRLRTESGVVPLKVLQPCG